MLKSTTRIIFNEFTQPIPLGRRHILRPTPGIAAGFGAYFKNITLDTTGDQLVMSQHLQYMDAQIISHSECSFRTGIFNAMNPNYLIKPIIHPTSHICSIQAASGLCFGTKQF